MEPKKSDDEKKLRDSAIQEATRRAILVPFSVMEIAWSGFELIKEMVINGNPNSITDAGVGALALRSCIKGASLNVKINTLGLSDKEFAKEILSRSSEIESKAETAESEILQLILSRINQEF